MKKKLFFFVTCFFLLSALTIFFASRNIQFSETIKNKEEEAKRLLKELKEQKEKNNANQKNENEDCQEETDGLPWPLNWTKSILSLVVCSLITVPTGRILAKKIDSCSDPGDLFVIDLIIFVILFFGLSPFLLAIAKDKDKSYKERYCLLWKSHWEPFVCEVLSCLFIISIYTIYGDNKNDNDTNELHKNNNNNKI